MTIVNRDVDMSGKIRIVWQMANGDSAMWSFREEPTIEQLEALEVKHIDFHLYDNVYKLIDIDEDDRELIKEFIYEIKSHPTVTYNQYLTWLAGRNWQNQAVIKTFIYKLATRLANNRDVELSDYTEQQILGKLRDWIVATPIRMIAKTILGNDRELGED